MKIDWSATFTKFALLFLLYLAIENKWVFLLATFLITYTYQSVIGMFYGMMPFPELDLMCMLAYSNGRPQGYINVLLDNTPIEKIKGNLKSYFEANPKCYSKIVMKFGDLYWKALPFEEAFNGTFREFKKPFQSKKEFEDFIAEDIIKELDWNQP